MIPVYGPAVEPNFNKMMFGGGHQRKCTKSAILLGHMKPTAAGKPFVESPLRRKGRTGPRAN